MTKQELEKRIRRQAGDLIYCWLYDSDKQYLGKNANLLLGKRNKQIAYLKGLAYAVAGTKEEEIYSWILDEIKNTYQQIKNPATGSYEPATPRLIIAALMLGETVKGKNWKKGIYGCKVGNTTGIELSTLASGDVNYVTIDQQPYSGGGNTLGIPTFDFEVSTSQPATYSLANVDANLVNNYQLNPETGLYELATVSDGTTTVDASTGTKLSASDQTLWTNITNCLGQIQELISGFATFLSGITAPEALSPLQVEDGWVEPEKKSESTLLSGGTGLLVGGAVLAAAFLTNDKKRK